MTEMMDLKQRELELNVELRWSSRHAMTAKMREDAVKNDLFTDKAELAESHMKCANLLWGHNEMVSRTQHAKVDANEALEAV